MTRGTNSSCEICSRKKCPICKKRHCKVIHDNCDSIPGAGRIKQDTKDLYNTLKGVNTTYGESKTFQYFQDLIKTNGANENSATLYYNSDENCYLLKDLTKGENPYGVKIYGGTPHAVATIHNHPNDTPPSGVDVLMAAKHALDNPDFQSAYVHTSSGVYTVFIENREKAMAFHKAYIKCNSEPGSTDVFKDGSYLDNLWDSSYKEFDKFSSNERHMLALSDVLRRVNAGISVAKGDHNTATFEVITTRVENEKVIPIKCK